MILKLVNKEGEEEEEHWSKKLWRLLNEGDFSAVEIGVTLFIITSVVVITIVIVIRCRKKQKRPPLPSIPQSKFFTNKEQLEQSFSHKSETLYEVINDSSKSQTVKENGASLFPDTKFLSVTATATTSSNSSNNEYSKDPTSCLTSSAGSNDGSQNPTPYFPDVAIFKFNEDHPNSFAAEDLKLAEASASHKCPSKTTNKYRALTLDRPRRKKRRSKQKSFDFQLSKTQADICNFYLPMTANKSISVDELLRSAVKSDECLSEYISRDDMQIPVIVITTPEQDKDLYLLKNNF